MAVLWSSWVRCKLNGLRNHLTHSTADRCIHRKPPLISFFFSCFPWTVAENIHHARIKTTMIIIISLCDPDDQSKHARLTVYSNTSRFSFAPALSSRIFLFTPTHNMDTIIGKLMEFARVADAAKALRVCQVVNNSVSIGIYRFLLPTRGVAGAVKPLDNSLPNSGKYS